MGFLVFDFGPWESDLDRIRRDRLLSRKTHFAATRDHRPSEHLPKF